MSISNASEIESSLSLGRAFVANAAPTSPAAGHLRQVAMSRVGERALPPARRVLDQADVNCCVSCALAAAMEILNPTWPELAPLFHYYVARFDVAAAADSRGSLFLDGGLVVLHSHGVCRHQDHPVSFTPDDAARRPSTEAYRRARERRLPRRGRAPGYRRIDGASRFSKIREFIGAGRPVILGLKLPSSYPHGFLDSRWRWLDPVELGGRFYRHCVVATGYNDLEGGLRVQDSQGPASFDRGCWWLGRRVVDSPLVEEAFALGL